MGYMDREMLVPSSPWPNYCKVKQTCSPRFNINQKDAAAQQAWISQSHLFFKVGIANSTWSIGGLSSRFQTSCSFKRFPFWSALCIALATMPTIKTNTVAFQTHLSTHLHPWINLKMYNNALTACSENTAITRGSLGSRFKGAMMCYEISFRLQIMHW